MAIQRPRRATLETFSTEPVRPLLDCHVSSLRDLPRNDKSEETGLPRNDVARNDREKYKMIFFASFQWLVLCMMSPITENENH